MYHHPIIPHQSYFLRTALIRIIVILALRAAKHSTWSACHKGLQTMFADADGLLSVGQHKAEHHLYSKNQRVKILYDRRLIKQSNMVGLCIAAKGRHSFLHQKPLLQRYTIIIFVEQHRSQIGKSNVSELLL